MSQRPKLPPEPPGQDPGSVPSPAEVEQVLGRMFTASVVGARKGRTGGPAPGKALNRPDEIGRRKPG